MSSYGMREGNAGEWLTSAVTRNPEGLLLLAAGVALLMRSGRSKSTDNYRKTVPSQTGRRQNFGEPEHSEPGVGDRVADAARRAGEYASEATDKVSETARSYASSAADYASEVGDAALERSRRIADQAWEATDYVTREQPWAVALAGLVAGAAVAAAFPPTRVERRTLGGVGDRLRSAAGAVGDQIMEAGRQAGEKLSEVAEERGLTSEGLKEAAQEVGETFSSALSAEEPNSTQASNRQETDEGAQTNPQSRQAPSGAEGRHSRSTQPGNRPAGSGGSPSSGGRR
jgi:ElaB/YqjD/DUF883 family membrane-anchored ribosome-binding protein